MTFADEQETAIAENAVFHDGTATFANVYVNAHNICRCYVVALVRIGEFNRVPDSVFCFDFHCLSVLWPRLPGAGVLINVCFFMINRVRFAVLFPPVVNHRPPVGFQRFAFHKIVGIVVVNHRFKKEIERVVSNFDFHCLCLYPEPAGAVGHILNLLQRYNLFSNFQNFFLFFYNFLSGREFGQYQRNGPGNQKNGPGRFRRFFNFPEFPF